MTLAEAGRERDAGQLRLDGWSAEAQARLGAASAIVVGAGALGSPAASYLAAGGVGRIGIVDARTVEPWNLHRQALHYSPEVGANKAENAALKLGALNPEVQAEPYPVRLEQMNARAIVTGADVVLDCSGCEATRLTLNEACCAERVPLVVGATDGLSGLVLSVVPGRSACYRCAFPGSAGEAPAESPRGILGAMAGVVGSAQALEALKLLTGVGRPLLDRILRLDGRDMEPTLTAVSRRSECPACAGAGAAPQST